MYRHMRHKFVPAGLSWVLIYRKEDYKRRRDAIDRLQKKGA